MNIQVHFPATELPIFMEVVRNSNDVHLDGRILMTEDLEIGELTFATDGAIDLQINCPTGPGRTAVDFVMAVIDAAEEM